MTTTLVDGPGRTVVYELCLAGQDLGDVRRAEAVLLGGEDLDRLLDTTVKVVNFSQGFVLTSFDLGDQAVGGKFGHSGGIPWCRGRWAQRV